MKASLHARPSSPYAMWSINDNRSIAPALNASHRSLARDAAFRVLSSAASSIAGRQYVLFFPLAQARPTIVTRSWLARILEADAFVTVVVIIRLGLLTTRLVTPAFAVPETRNGLAPLSDFYDSQNSLPQRVD